MDYDRACEAVVPEKLGNLEDCVKDLAGYLEGQAIWGHPLTKENVIPPASIPSIAGQVFSSVYNPNIIWDEYSHRLGEAEVEAVHMCASLVGYDKEKTSGVFTWGGTGTIFYGIKMGLEKALPGSFAKGYSGQDVVVSSEVAHYAKLNALGWLGMGTDNLVSIPSDQDNSCAWKNWRKSFQGFWNKERKSRASSPPWEPPMPLAWTTSPISPGCGTNS